MQQVLYNVDIVLIFMKKFSQGKKNFIFIFLPLITFIWIVGWVLFGFSSSKSTKEITPKRVPPLYEIRKKEQKKINAKE